LLVERFKGKLHTKVEKAMDANALSCTTQRAAQNTDLRC
jgi:hypothetical protein